MNARRRKIRKQIEKRLYSDICLTTKRLRGQSVVFNIPKGITDFRLVIKNVRLEAKEEG